MIQPVSVVIICRNEAHIIARTLESVKGFAGEVVVVDSGSADGTQEIVLEHGARLIETEWQGFGQTKNLGLDAARFNWILSIDADEVVDEELAAAIGSANYEDEGVVYQLVFRNHIGNKPLRYGEWGGDKHIRIFNRLHMRWTEVPVHEKLILPEGVKVRQLPGFILHYTMKDIAEYSAKMVDYALLNGEKYFKAGKRSSWFKLYFSPGFNFFRHYIIGLGFLDGWQGYVSARMTAFYTYLKYARLRELCEQEKGEVLAKGGKKTDN